jgi:thiamine transport system permease protein
MKPAQSKIWLVGWLFPLAFLGLFYFYPLGRILSYSFFISVSGGWLQLWKELSESSVVPILWFTFWQAALSTLFTLALGLPGAYLFAKFQFKGKSLLQALTTIPFILPTLVVSAAFSALLGPRGWLNLGLMSIFDLPNPPIQFMNSLTAILTAHVFYNTTIVLRTVSSFWANLDPKLELAARSLGATRWQTFLRVTLPLLGPAIVAACLLVFTFDFTSFGVVLILGGPKFATLEVEIYTQALSFLNLPLASVLSLLQLFFTVGFTFIYQWLSNRLVRPISLQPQAASLKSSLTWTSRIGATLIILVLVCLFVTPLLALALRSISLIEMSDASPDTFRFSLEFYKQLNQNPRQSLFYVSPLTSVSISLAYALITVIISLLIGIPAAWTLARQPEARFTRWLDLSLMLPLGTSSVTLGLGFILAFSRPPLDLSTSILLIPLAHTLVALPFVVRNLIPALRSIKPGLHQAAIVLGATPLEVIRLIDMPLISRALLVAATFAFTISLGEFGATSLMARPEFPTIPLAIYRLLGQPGALNYGQAMAMGTLLMVVCIIGMLAIEKFRPRELTEF